MITTNHTTLRMSGALYIEHLTALKLHIGVNSHGWAIVEGEAGENALEQLSGALAGREQNILTLDESGAEKCLFAGVIREAELVRVGGYNRFHVELLSGTCLMDREVRSRSFQDVGRTYSQVAEQVCSEYSGGAAICTVGEDKTLGRPVIQYRETDWEFLMRMASHCGGVLVPETHRGLPRLWFGFPERSFTCEFPEDAYTSGISQRYYELGGSAAGYSKTDFFYYDVESPQLCDLGWYTVFKGQPFIISEKSAQLDRGELIFTYRLGRPGLGFGKMLYNEKISGMTLLGEVLETARETLKLKLDIDVGWNPGGPYPYTWRPETGNFMYCMPKVGTRVSLYCPDYDEKNAIAVNCVRTNGDSCGRMSTPSKRSFVTEHGKEMNLYPDEMSAFGGGQGLFRLADDIGISISSEKPIVIVGRECVQFDTSLLVIEAPNGEIIIAKKHYPETEAVDSSFIICNRYDIWTKKYTHIEGWICIAFGSVNDSLEEVQKGWNWFGFGLAVIGIVAVVAVVSFVTLSGMGPFVLGCMAVGAVVGGIRGAKVAHEAGLTGSDFLAVVGLGALAGGLEGAFVGVGVSAAISLGAAFMANPLTFSLAGIFGLTTINFLPNILAATKNGLQTLLGFIPQWQIEETMAAIGKNPCVTMITQYGLAPEFFYAVGFEQDEDGIYHARLDAPQAAFGYNDFYDFAFGYGTDMSVQRIPFTCDGNDYALWAWKGDYLNLGAGAELGIYEQFGDSEHYIVNKEISLPMTLRLEDEKGNLIFSYEPEEKQWWITGFNPFTPSPNVQNLKAIYTVDFSGGNEKMYADVKEAFMDLEDTPDWAIKDWLPDDTNYTIQFEL